MAGRGCQEGTGHPASSPLRPTPSWALTGARDPASGGRRGVRPSRGLFRPPCPSVSGPGVVGAWDRGSAAAGQELAGRPGRGTGDRRQVGPSLGGGGVRGGARDRGPGKVRAGARRNLRKCLLGIWEKLCPWDKAPCFCPGQRKWQILQQNSGEAGRTGRKEGGPPRPVWMGTRDERMRLWVALGHDVWTLPCQCLMFVAYGYFKTK